MSLEKQPKVGIGVIVKKDNKILLGKRINAHGQDTWSAPGGHLEFGESLETCARREVLEEVGIQIKNLRFYDISNDIFVDEQKHYLTVLMISDFESGIETNLEPHKCEGWKWFSIEELSKLNLFLPLKNLILQKKDLF